MPKQLNAFDELTKELHGGETIEAIVFGAWGWGRVPNQNETWQLSYDEPDPPPVPFEKRGVLLTADEAKPLMNGWSFNGGFWFAAVLRRAHLDESTRLVGYPVRWLNRTQFSPAPSSGHHSRHAWGMSHDALPSVALPRFATLGAANMSS